MTKPSNSGKILTTISLTALYSSLIFTESTVTVFGQDLGPRYNSFLFFDLPKTSTKDQWVVLGARWFWFLGSWCKITKKSPLNKQMQDFKPFISIFGSNPALPQSCSSNYVLTGCSCSSRIPGEGRPGVFLFLRTTRLGFLHRILFLHLQKLTCNTRIEVWFRRFLFSIWRIFRLIMLIFRGVW